LTQLARAEEFAQSRHYRTNVDQRYRRELFLIANRHAFFDDALHAAQTDPQFILDQLTHRLDAAVTEMINIVRRFNAVLI